VTVLKGYLISITAAAILCSIAIRLSGNKGTASAVIKLLAGLFMTITVLKPVLSIEIQGVPYAVLGVTQQAEQAARIGEEMASNEISSIIIDRTQAYILDKAATLGVKLDVEVVLSDFVPKKVRLSGAVSPYAKAQLSHWIEENLGLPPEAQEWS